MNYLTESIESEFVLDDQQTYYWAEFPFEDETNEHYTTTDPHYTRQYGDFHWLRVGALDAHYKLLAGEP